MRKEGGSSIMFNTIFFGLICFSIGLVTGVALVLTIMVKAMKMIPKVGKV